MRRIRHGDQHGDTIVEVLIAIVVVASVLGGAFVVSNNSTKNVRKSQEHSEALQILQGQIEQYRAFAGSQDTEGAAAINNECMIGAAKVTTCNFGDASRYTVRLTSSNPVANDNLITVTGTVTWLELGGTTGSETLVYRADVNRN